MRFFWLALTISLTLAACGKPQPSADQLQLDDLRGQWVVINYWAIWCKPCIQEIPELNSLDEFPQVTVLGVNFDGIVGEELEQQMQKLGVAFTNLDQDPAAQLGVQRPDVLPTTLLIDPQGILQDILIGPQTLHSLADATGQVVATD